MSDLAASLALALDPVRLMERAGFAADTWQADLLRSDARHVVMLCSRQSGKSTVTSCLAAHQAAFVPGSLTLIVSPSLRQSCELYLKVRGALTAIGDLLPPMPQENATTLRLANGSRVISLPGSEKTVRGFSAPDLVIEDEASRVDDAMHQALRPMLAVSGGRFVLLSTPFGRRGHLFETWEHGGPEWLRVRVTAHDVPRISPVWLEQERAAIGDWWFRQEYLCEFVDATNQLFGSGYIHAALSADVAPLPLPRFGGDAA